MKNLEDLYREEDAKLYSYATKNQETDDRVYPENPHEYRMPLQRDRDRIFHSKAFKRLEYKTQVFINSVGDHFRTRLTHTLEVAGVSRTISTALGLNSQLSEVIALAHDLGHTPFGHAGQDILSELMKSFGGFEHNKQSLRIVQKLENRYPDFPGLNLCRVSLIGLMKHGGEYGKSDLQILRSENGPSMEAIVADLSDEIAYSHHDLDDGFEMQYIQMEDFSQVEIWKRNYEIQKAKLKDVRKEILVRSTIRAMMNEMITDLLKNTDQNIQKYSIVTKEDFMRLWKEKVSIISYSEKMNSNLIELKKYLYENLYKHPKVVEKSNYGQRIIEFLFLHLEKNSDKIPENYRKQMDEEGLHRVLSDYISGMTDRYAEWKAKEFGFKDSF
jgi:dGTPase